jgi:cysteine synthase
MEEIHPVVASELIDEVMVISDREAFDCVRRLARDCGVLAGSSGGANVCAAIRVAERLGSGRRVVTVIPDSAERYLSQDIFEQHLEAS